jgi:hypothetical protein
MPIQTRYTTFSAEDIRSLEPPMKIGLLASLNAAGQPHITLLSSLMASSPTQVAFGQFTEGMSKKHILTHPKAGFLVMSLDRHLWRGKATFTHTASAGKDYDYYNNTPMFRYNAYFGVHTVYYFDLADHTGRAALPMNRIIVAALQTAVARRLAGKADSTAVMNHWTRAFLNKLDNLKFLAYAGADGYPVLIPAIQAQCLDAHRVLFSTSVYTDELDAIPAGASLAVYGMALTMEDVLLRGTYEGIRRVGGIRAGVVSVDWVYNSMPPVPGQIYPPVEIKPVTEFSQ